MLNYKNARVGTGLKSNSDSFYQLKRQSYKLIEDGRYGNLTIDINQLKCFNKLVVSKDSEIVINQDVDDDFIELIQRKHIQNNQKIYLEI